MYFKYKMEYVWFPVNTILLWLVLDKIIVTEALHPKSIYNFVACFFVMFIVYIIFHIGGCVAIGTCLDNKLKMDISDHDISYIVYKIIFYILIFLYVFYILSLG